MNKKLIINANHSETRVALLEDDTLAEIQVQRSTEHSLVGNIYMGKVSRVLPGMQSAFIDIGIDRTAFLYGGDAIDPIALSEHNQKCRETPLNESLDNRHTMKPRPIEQLLKDGQQIVVQVAKDPIGTKGARVTMFTSLPGRYLVFMPEFVHLGISRRILDSDHRSAIQDIATEIKPDDAGLIIRTAAANVTKEQLEADLHRLVTRWEAIQDQAKHASAPATLYKEPDIHVKVVRDLYSDEISEVVVDNSLVAESIAAFMETSIPGASSKVKTYEGREPIFDKYDIEMDIAKALGHKVWLPSGGYLIVDQTEALTSFDVNTGRFVGRLSAQETILQTNLEAVTAIVDQLRLRNIGGIIVLDFIDMDDEVDREKVYNELEAALQMDKARTNVLRISELGLVQMTRKRTRESLERQLMEPCPHCDGLGNVRSTQTHALDLIRDIKRQCLRSKRSKVKVQVRSDIRDWILQREKARLDEVCEEFGVKVDFKDAKPDLADIEKAPYEIISQD